MQAVVYALWKAEPAAVAISSCLISLRHTHFLGIQLRLGHPRLRRGCLDLYDECYGIDPRVGRVMLRVPGLPKDASTATAVKVAELETPTSTPSTTTRSKAAKEKAAAAEPTPIQPTPSTSKTTMPTTTAAVTQPARTISTTTPVQATSQQVGTVPVQDYSTHYLNAPYQQPADPISQASTAESATQYATSTSCTPATIPPTYPAYTNTEHITSTAMAPLNPLYNLNNYGYAYGGLGFGTGSYVL